MWNLVLAAALLAAPPSVSAEMLDGSATEGRLVALGDEAVVIESEGGRQEFSVAGLLVVDFHPSETNDPPEGASPPSLTAPPISVRLVDGTRIAAADYVETAGEATVSLASGERLTLKMDWIDEVRFASFDAKLEELWETFRKRDVAGDLVVIRTDGAADVLDGVLRSVSTTNVTLDFQRREVSLARQRVLGVVRYHATPATFPDELCTVVASDGSRLVAARTTLDGDLLHVSTRVGLEITLPTKRVTTLDYSRGKVEFLSRLEPRESLWTPYFAVAAGAAAPIESFGAPHRDQALEGGPMRLGNRSYNKGLSMRSGTRLTYRLPGEFRELTALAGIDDRMNGGGDVELSIDGDGRRLWTGKISGAARPVALQVDIRGVRDLTIVVDYGEDLDIADHLDLVEARISK